MGIGRFKNLFKSSVEKSQDEPISDENQRKIAEAVLAEYKTIDVKAALQVPSIVKRHFESVLEILDQHGIVDVKALPVKGKGHIVDVPESWGPSLIDVVNGVFDADKWAGNRGDMRAVWNKQVPVQFKKLMFPEAMVEETGSSMKHTASSLFFNSHAHVKNGGDVRVSRRAEPSKIEDVTHSKAPVFPAPDILQ